MSGIAHVTDVIPPSRETVQFLVESAKYPLFRGKPTRARRVLEIGKCYYWKQHVLPATEVPSELWEWAAAQGLGHCNSILVNVYEEPRNYIGWHSDATRPLASGRGTVTSFSFALNPEDREAPLAEMQFTSLPEPVELRDGTRVEFDAIEHGKQGIKHRVRKTLRPRINLTFRCLR